MFQRRVPELQVRVSSGSASSALIRKTRTSRSSREDAIRRARRLQIVLAVFSLSILKLITSAFFSRPQVTTLFVMWLFGVAFFVSTEASGILHASQKTENKFWMGMASMLATILLFLADDSPFRVPSTKRGIFAGWIMVATSTYVVHVFHKRSHRKALENRSAIPKNKSYREAISSLGKEPGRNLVKEVNESLSTLESSLIPGGFRRIFDKGALLQNERKIIDCFREANRAELNHLVLHVNMNVVLYRLKNHSNRRKSSAASLAASASVSAKTLSSAASSDGSNNELLTSPQNQQRKALTSSATTVASSGAPNPATTVLLVAGALPKSLNDGTQTPTRKRTASLDHRLFGNMDESDEDEDGTDAKEDELVKTHSQGSSGYYHDDVAVEGDLEKKNHRNALVELLAKDRLADLTTSARASVLDAIQVIGMMRNPLTKDRAQRWAAGIILDTRGDQLSELKTITDAKGSVHSMHKLVYNDITDEAIRASLLSHFQANKRTKLGRKVLSDVDDTLLSSGGTYPAGIDDSYPRHAIYPGAGAFYEGLDRGVTTSFGPPSFYGSKIDMDTDSEGEEDFVMGGTVSPARVTKKKRVVVGNLVFLSARPHVYKDMAERRVYSKFERMIRAKNLHAMPTLLPGDLESGQAYMLRGDFEPMARKKLRNMVEYHSIYPEFTHVFVCDNGQADVRAAELMKERLGTSLEAVYVHRVQPLDKTFGFSENSCERWHKMGIVFYKTFVGAATDACRRNFIEPDALRQVCINAAKEFLDISSLTGSKFPGGLYGIEERRIELVTDFVKANDLLEARGYQAVQHPRALCIFPVGTTVHTRHFGEGFVRAFRPLDGIYEIALLGDKLIGHFSALDLRSSAAAWGKVSLTSGGLFLGQNAASLAHQQNHPTSIQVGCKVLTPYGEGVVRRYRPSDEIFEVILTRWPGLAFLREDSVEKLVPEQSTGRRILGLGQALIRRTFSSTVRASPPLKPVVNPSASPPAGPAAAPTLATPQTTPHSAALTINVSAPGTTPINVIVLNKFEVGAKVLVPPFGLATVTAETRTEDNIVEVAFDGFKGTGYVRASQVTPVMAASNTNILSSFKLPVKDAAARVMSAMFGVGGSTGQSNKAPALKVSMLVETPFGKGMVVKEARDTDGVIHVKLDWGADAFLNVNAVKVVAATGGVKSRIMSLLTRSETPIKVKVDTTDSTTRTSPSPPSSESSPGLNVDPTNSATNTTSSAATEIAEETDAKFLQHVEHAHDDVPEPLAPTKKELVQL